ncbi:protein bark beetle-like isoform X2 [Rhagoletis pomonella]|uniref:protein bark beetle-like isoform X2 n=1 Tax=Rhagoletis pomonella TaxID=28610 RepID=UPI001783CE36|nr:protein bark beetle-like isoform X2 [Rhagoletis pomonella]
MGRATIVAGTAGQQYVENIFENPENDYEMITVNNSITIELWRSKIEARHNYWSYNNTISVQSRIRDKSDDPLLFEVQAVPFQMNNLTILDGKCPPGWALLQDTCFIYVGAPLTFHEARAFCRSENSTMPFIRTDSTTLWKYLQGQMRHLKYTEKVWIQDFNHIDRCTSFAFTTTEVEDCGNEFGFICETDPRVVIDPLSWRADIFAVSIISAFILAIILLLMVAFCWYAKSKQRHAQRLQRRNSIRQSLRSLNSIDPQGSLRRRNFNMSTSTGTLSKQLGQDYKMMGNGSIDSMDKSVLSSEASFEAYDNQTAHPSGYQKPSYNDYVTQHSVKGGANGAAIKSNEPYKIATIGSVSKASTARGRTPWLPDSFELSYRNEGFRDNSTYASTLTTSVATSIAEDTPIIHQTDTEDANSDYYGNASTLPLHSGGNESLSFLRELKQNLPPPAYNKPHRQSHSSFLSCANGGTTRPTSSSQLSNDSHSSTLSYEQKIDNLHFTPVTQRAEGMPLFRHELAAGGLPTPPPDMRRPDSYYTAVRSRKAQPQLTHMAPPPSNAKLGVASKPQAMGATKPMTAAKNHGYSQNGSQNGRRPKTVYKTASPEPTAYHLSRSEALLETDFDDELPSMVPLSTNSRSYSQPLETAM